jgi:pimeloyl-ACP methyl ester carboxylesterase
VAALVLVAPAIFALPGQGRELGLLEHERSGPLLAPPPARRADSAASMVDGAELHGGGGSSSSSNEDGGSARALGRADSASSLGGGGAAGPAAAAEGPQQHLLVLRDYPPGAAPPPPPQRGPPGRLAALSRAAASAAQAVAAASVLAAVLLLKPLIVLALRLAVRSRRFWERGLASAYHDSGRLSAALVDAYRLPQLVRGWEDGMVAFVLARLAGASRLAGRRGQGGAGGGAGAAAAAASGGIMLVDDTSGGAAAGGGKAAAPAPAAAAAAAAAASAEAGAEGSLADQLAATLARHRIPVLIVHGEQDRVVPIGNSRRLARRLPGCRLAVFTQCGHMPQEELPQGFVAAVAEFLEQQVAGAGGRGQGAAAV